MQMYSRFCRADYNQFSLSYDSNVRFIYSGHIHPGQSRLLRCLRSVHRCAGLVTKKFPEPYHNSTYAIVIQILWPFDQDTRRRPFPNFLTMLIQQSKRTYTHSHERTCKHTHVS